MGEFSGPQTLMPGNTTDFVISGEEFTTGGVAQGKSSYYVFRRVVGAWRAAGMSGIFGWWPNLYSVKKVLPGRHAFTWDDLTTPGPKPVMVTHAWWLPETEGKSPYNYGIWELNCNLLIPMGYQDKSGFGGGPISGMLVKVYKV